MSIEIVKEYLKQWNRDKDIMEFAESTATSIMAAEVLETVPGRIAKSVTLKSKGGAILVVASGDVRIDNKKFKAEFGFSPKMLSSEDALQFTGFAVGGVCPFALPKELPVYLDRSLQRFESVYPACGNSNSMIEVTIPELEEYSNFIKWVDVAKIS